MRLRLRKGELGTRGERRWTRDKARRGRARRFIVRCRPCRGCFVDAYATGALDVFGGTLAHLLCRGKERVCFPCGRVRIHRCGFMREWRLGLGDGFHGRYFVVCRG